MQPEQAAGTLQEIEALRNRTRSTLGDIWVPCVIFGALMMIGEMVDRLVGGAGAAPAIFWALLGPVGGSLTASYYRRRDHRLGAERRMLPYVVTAVAMIVGTVGMVFLGTALGIEKLAAVGALMVVAAGYLVFARLSRSTMLSVTSVGLALAVLAMWAVGLGSSQIGFVGNELYGLALLVVGLLNRPRRMPA
jgi:hypothetical protein